MIDPARSFARAAADYERGRPSWPAQALEGPGRALGLDPGAAVLDLGAGTGKLTRLLVERFARVVAVEPSAEMRALIADGAEVVAGTAEAIPLPDAAVGAVFCGEAFHWFDWPRALCEIARVLQPRGGLVLMWNRPGAGSLHSAEWPTGVSDALDRLADPAPPERRYWSFAWRDALSSASLFEPLRSDVVPNGREIDGETLVAWIGSWSRVATLADRQRTALLAEVAAHLTEPTYRATLETHVYWTRLAALRGESRPGRPPRSPSP